MIIHGKERNLMLTIGASIKIAKLCPQGDLSRVGELFQNNSLADMFDKVCDIIIALNEGYEMNRAFEVEDYKADVITKQELLALNMMDIIQMKDEILRSMSTDSAGSIETESSKKKEPEE